MVMEWLILKENILSELKKSDTKDIIFIKKWLKFNRLVNTCRNLLNKGVSYQTMCETSKPFNDALMLLDDIIENHSDIMVSHNTANGFNPITNLGDLIC